MSTEEITLATNGILSTIRVLSESITDDYEKLVSEASEEISLSKKLVERKMAKQKNFYDTYDALFQKPKWSFFLSQEQTQQSNFLTPIKSGKTTDEKRKTKKNKKLFG